MTQFFSFLTLEVSLFLLNNLRADYELGWFSQPSWGEAIKLAGILALALIFGWLACNGEKSLPLSKIIEKIFHPDPKYFTSLYFLLILIFGLSIIYFLPPRDDFPTVLRMILKHKDLAGLVLILSIEILAVNASARFSTMNTTFLKIGSFIYRHALLIIFCLLIFIKLILLVPVTRGLLVLRDTYVYWLMAKQILYGSLDVAQFHHYPPFFSIILSPVLQFGLRDSLRNMTIFNVVISSTAIFPLYLIAREFLTKKFSLIVYPCVRLISISHCISSNPF